MFLFVWDRIFLYPPASVSRMAGISGRCWVSRFLFTASLAVLSLALRSEHYITDGKRSGLFDFPCLGYREVGFLKSIETVCITFLTSESVTLPKTENIPVCKAGVKQDPQEEEQSKPPARSAKTFSSFFGEHLSPLVPLGWAARRLQTLLRQCWLDKAWKVGLSGVRSSTPCLPLQLPGSQQWNLKWNKKSQVLQGRKRPRGKSCPGMRTSRTFPSSSHDSAPAWASYAQRAWELVSILDIFGPCCKAVGCRQNKNCLETEFAYALIAWHLTWPPASLQRMVCLSKDWGHLCDTAM